jgi:hypothetical protein
MNGVQSYRQHVPEPQACGNGFFQSPMNTLWYYYVSATEDPLIQTSLGYTTQKGSCVYAASGAIPFRRVSRYSGCSTPSTARGISVPLTLDEGKHPPPIRPGHSVQTTKLQAMMCGSDPPGYGRGHRFSSHSQQRIIMPHVHLRRDNLSAALGSFYYNFQAS